MDEVEGGLVTVFGVARADPNMVAVEVLLQSALRHELEEVVARTRYARAHRTEIAADLGKKHAVPKAGEAAAAAEAAAAGLVRRAPLICSARLASIMVCTEVIIRSKGLRTG